MELLFVKGFCNTSCEILLILSVLKISSLKYLCLTFNRDFILKTFTLNQQKCLKILFPNKILRAIEKGFV